MHSMKPTPFQEKRAELANLVFDLHNTANKIIASTAFDLVNGVDAECSADLMAQELKLAIDLAVRQIKEKA